MLRNVSLVLASLSFLAIAGCEPRKTDPIVAQNEKWFVVTEISQPKHFYVSFREEGTNYHFRREYVSKHCNAWKKLKIGSRWKLTEVVRKGENGLYSELQGVRYEFCDKIEAL